MIQLVDVDALVVRDGGVLDVDLPAVEILHRDQAAGGLRRGDELARDVAAIEPIVGGEDRLLAVLAGLERLALCLDELRQRREQLGLLEDLPRQRRGPRLRPRGSRFGNSTRRDDSQRMSSSLLASMFTVCVCSIG